MSNTTCTPESTLYRLNTQTHIEYVENNSTSFLVEHLSLLPICMFGVGSCLAGKQTPGAIRCDPKSNIH